MCHPSLTEGMCCICYGTLTPENTLYDDLHEGRGGIHRGKCAILGGIYPDLAAAITCEVFMKRMHNHPTNTCPAWHALYAEYMKYIDVLTDEDFYDMSGPT